MESDLDTLTRLLLDPCLTTGEAEREAAAVPRPPAERRPPPRPREAPAPATAG
jgi:hypothetical protein